MEMIIFGSPVSQGTNAASVQTASAKPQGGAGSGFQQTLVQHIVAEPGGSQSQSQEAAPGPIAQLASFTVLANSAVVQTQPDLESLMQLIDGLIDRLDADDEEAAIVPEARAEELASALEGLYALLALMGVPVVHVRQAPEAVGSSEPQNDGPTPSGLPNVKRGLQDALLQLQAALEQGSHKRVQGQEPVALAAKQVEALVSVLRGETSPQLEAKAARTPSDIPAWAIAHPSAGRDAAALLQRLSQQIAHPSYAAFATESGEPSVQSEGGFAAQPQAETAINHSPALITAGNAREFAPLIAQGAATGAFVLADDFADTMQGLIMHKFDVRTINGISEAKIVLFPEHLGQVDVRITMQNGVLTALFQTDTAMAKDMLENQMAQLRSALQSQGLHVDRLEVTESRSAEQLSGQNGQNQGNSQSFDGRQGFRDEAKVTDTLFESELAEQAAIQEMGYGRTINETV